MSNVLWNEEAHFKIQGSANSHNCRTWAMENPRTFLETKLHDVKVTVWCGFTAYNVIWPFFYKQMRDSTFEINSVRGEKNADMLQNRILLRLAHKHLLENMTFIKNDASSLLLDK